MAGGGTSLTGQGGGTEREAADKYLTFDRTYGVESDWYGTYSARLFKAKGGQSSHSRLTLIATALMNRIAFHCFPRSASAEKMKEQHISKGTIGPSTPSI